MVNRNACGHIQLLSVNFSLLSALNTMSADYLRIISSEIITPSSPLANINRNFSFKSCTRAFSQNTIVLSSLFHHIHRFPPFNQQISPSIFALVSWIVFSLNDTWCNSKKCCRQSTDLKFDSAEKQRPFKTPFIWQIVCMQNKFKCVHRIVDNKESARNLCARDGLRVVSSICLWSLTCLLFHIFVPAKGCQVAKAATNKQKKYYARTRSL